MWALRAAAAAAWVNGLGFGAYDLFPIRALAAGEPVPVVVSGFPVYGGGPFEGVGVPTTMPLLVTFLVVCVLEVAAGVLLWMRRRSGAVLFVVSAVPGAVFWWGFALPFGWVLAAVGLVLVAWGRPALLPSSST
ncbi:MAG: hypothetical protein ABS81_14890 [Pseudonocardia sp. SCN 72-86]|nr:MAG: hypothetical protein ABS81_14890 [Pseudonocardia sp. SCN 72-86]